MQRQIVPALFLIAFLVSACHGPARDIDIRFAAVWGDQPLGCQDNAGGVALSDLRFFVHDVELLDSNGGVAATLQIAPLAGWQSADLALVDLEDGSGHCANGTAERHARVTGRLPAGEYRGLRFTVAVPPALNHGDPLTASGPLTQSGMHWHWRSGYKFMRAGVDLRGDGAWLHLGSSRCHGVIGDLQGCDAGNRPQVVIDNFLPGRHAVAVDLALLFSGLDLADGAISSCQMGPDETDCEPLLRALGIDPASGSSYAPAPLFRAVELP